jgi:hypothetical protein
MAEVAVSTQMRLIEGSEIETHLHPVSRSCSCARSLWTNIEIEMLPYRAAHFDFTLPAQIFAAAQLRRRIYQE